MSKAKWVKLSLLVLAAGAGAAAASGLLPAEVASVLSLVANLFGAAQ